MTRSTRYLFLYRRALVSLFALAGACASDDSDTRTGAANAALAPALTECVADAECVAVSSSMCPVCGGNQAEWLFVRKDAQDAVPVERVDSCDPCYGTAPRVLCAEGRCAAFSELQGGRASSTCFSPTQALERAYFGAVGCDCAASEPDVCATAPDNRHVALSCLLSDGRSRWLAGVDGPCRANVIE